jgi:hypothetical protein
MPCHTYIYICIYIYVYIRVYTCIHVLVFLILSVSMKWTRVHMQNKCKQCIDLYRNMNSHVVYTPKCIHKNCSIYALPTRFGCHQVSKWGTKYPYVPGFRLIHMKANWCKNQTNGLNMSSFQSPINPTKFLGQSHRRNPKIQHRIYEPCESPVQPVHVESSCLLPSTF